MCGICGIYTYNSQINPDHLLSMTRIMRHRGPDDEGFMLAKTGNGELHFMHHEESIPEIKNQTEKLHPVDGADLAFGFRRLSILDLSPRGHQPMHFPEAGLTIVFNGEIYNYLELRRELGAKGYVFHSNTDTEVILKAYAEWGEECVNKFNGMWAFALWDSRDKKLFCSRDRFGIKPFYFYQGGNSFIFASEIKAILQVIDSTPDFQTIYQYLAYGYSDYDERTFFEKIKQLKGGHNLVIKNNEIEIYKYYDLNIQPKDISFENAREQFRELLTDAVSMRLRSDVPLGYALSGGVDSSSIVSIAARLNHGSNNTFSMIYPGDPMDESHYVKKVVEKAGVNHFYISPTADDFLHDLHKFVWHQEEPFAGTSYYGEFKLRNLIRDKGVTVSLEGQGADEIVTGYTSLILPYFFDLLKNGQFITLAREVKNFYSIAGSFFSVIRRFVATSLYPDKKTGIKALENKLPFIEWHAREFIRKTEQQTYKNFNSGSYLNDSLYEMFFYTSLPQQLVRADKNAMAFSVECRFPFLDYRLVEFAFSLPWHFKTWNGTTKYILREALKDLLPEEVYNRRDKIGFAIPNNAFDTKQIREFVFDEIRQADLAGLPMIDKEKFLNYYETRGNALDWKFWKVSSLLSWYSMFLKS